MFMLGPIVLAPIIVPGSVIISVMAILLAIIKNFFLPSIDEGFLDHRTEFIEFIKNVFLRTIDEVVLDDHTLGCEMSYFSAWLDLSP